MGACSRFIRVRVLAAAGIAIATVGSVTAGAVITAGPATAATGIAAIPPAAAGRTAHGLPAGAGMAQTAVVGGAGATTGPFGISKTELLINGDRVTVSGKRTSIAMAGTGFAAAVTEFRTDGRLYVVPDTALAFLGRGLDLSLFDTAALPGGGRLPVRISYIGRVPRLPGITITSAAGGVAAGYLTTASAPAFGAALARQFAADHDSASYGTDGLFGGGVTVSLAGAPRAPGAQGALGARRTPPAPGLPIGRPKPTPGFPMHVLTVRGFNAAGKADTGDMVYLTDSDNEAYFGDIYESGNLFYHGTALYSVPSGHYWALSVFFTTGKHPSVHIVVDPRFTVSGNTTLTIRARSASQPVTFVTPKPATLSDIDLLLADRVGPFSVNVNAFIAEGGLQFWLSPTRQPLRSGTLREFVTATLTLLSQGPPRPDTNPAAYYLAFQGPNGTIGSQRFVADSLATVNATYSSDVATTGGLALTGVPSGLLADNFLFIITGQLTVPARQTEYLTASPDVYWLGQYYQSWATLSGGQADTTRVFIPGSTLNLGWNTYPLHTALNSSVLGGNDPLGAELSATRDGNALSVYVTPFSDSTTGHTGSGFIPTFIPGFTGSVGHISGSYRIDVNGAVVASGKATQDQPGLGAQANLPAKPSTVAFTLNASRTGALYPLSTTTSTTWSWRSVAGPGTDLPSGWVCADGSPSCEVESLLTLGYDVAGIAVDGTAPAGAQVVRLTIGQQEFATASAITSASASVSFDGGATWQPAVVTGSGGTRYAVFSAPAGSYVALKVTAGDAAGDTITETLMRAYATATPAFAVRGGHGRSGSTQASGGYVSACPATSLGDARCFVLYSPRNAAAKARAAGFGAVSAPAGWGATDIERAYRLPVGKNPHETVAVVEAYNTPGLQSYLNTYRRQYHLPPCTTANRCLRIVNEAGRAAPLPANSTGNGWDLEATLDVDMVSAACPRCHILVVEASSQAVPALAAADNTAARLGAAAVSNSYGVRENGEALLSARAYDHPGHAIVVASGDYGFTAASFPADLATVTAVGGTELSRARNERGWSETVWNEFPGAGSSGCSAYVAKPRWQHDRHCPGRTVADVAALAWDLAIYEKTYGGWVQVAGTSASSPIVAGIYALADNAGKIKPGYEYAHTRSLFDITTGNNDWWFFGGGSSCGHDYLCVAKKGYDAPTGMGTPDGIGAF